jgi:hypothetical protein
MDFMGYPIVASTADVLNLYLHRLGFFVQRASQAHLGWSTNSNGSCCFVYDRSPAKLRPVPGEL